MCGGGVEFVEEEGQGPGDAGLVGTGDGDGYGVLRISGWGDGVEQGPVGFAGVEQGAEAVVLELAEPEGGYAFDAFDQVVDRYLERVGWEPRPAGCVRDGHVADEGSGESVGALLAEASGDLLAEALVLSLESLDLVEGVFKAPFQRFGGGTLGEGTVTVSVRGLRRRSISARMSGWR